MLDWLLKELGAEGNVERVSLDSASSPCSGSANSRSAAVRSKEHKQPAFLRIHPFGQVPALEAGGVSVFESGACLLYIADKWGGLDTPEQRGAAASWVVWANATFWPAVVGGSLTQKLPTLAGPVNELLSRQPFVAGDKWGVADCAVASYLHYAVVFVGVDWKPWPAIVAYLQRTSERPAFKATVGSE